MGKEAKYVVRLSSEERGRLEDIVARGRVAKATRQRAQVLLRADQEQKGSGIVDEAIVDLVGVSLSTVHRVRQQFVEEGLEASLCRKPATNRQYRKLDPTFRTSGFHFPRIVLRRQVRCRSPWLVGPAAPGVSAGGASTR
jgi:hypothetical protein